jgi:hypothetical protein
MAWAVKYQVSGLVDLYSSYAVAQKFLHRFQQRDEVLVERGYSEEFLPQLLWTESELTLDTKENP